MRSSAHARIAERGDGAEADHRDEERDAEPRLLGERREVAVEEVDDGELERVLRPQHEGEDPDVDRQERSDDGRGGERRGSAARERRATQHDESQHERPE